MWLEPLARLFISMTLLGQTDAAAPPSAQLITTRQAVFAIPFVVKPEKDPNQQPTELQLFVSTDRGGHWNLYGKAQPSQKQFVFRAGNDDEYWFAIRTVDRSGQVRPENIQGPGLRVAVDTKPPTLKISAQKSPTGQIRVQWESDEQDVKPEALTLQFRTVGSETWQPVVIETPQKNARNGETSFWPQPGAGEIEIQAKLVDAAGNAAVENTKILLAQGQSPAAPRLDPTGSVAIAINPAVGANAEGIRGTQDAWPTIPGLPAGERPRAVNSRLFQLEYEIDSVGPSGIGRVELWGTRDAGKTWRSFTVDNDNRSPLMVNVEEEGVYGFRIVVVNGAGFGNTPPQSGDLPDLWVCVDLTKPTAQIISAKQGTDSEVGQLVIAWQAEDHMPAARPISLSFSANRSGPWLPIASGLENTGRYAWPIDGRTPPRVYLRLEAADEAGNVGVFETAQAVSIDQSRPMVRVRDVRAVGQSDAKTDRRR